MVTIHRSAKDHSLFLTSFLDLLDLHRLSGTETDAEVLNPFVAVLVKATLVAARVVGFATVNALRYLLVQWTFFC